MHLVAGLLLGLQALVVARHRGHSVGLDVLGVAQHVAGLGLECLQCWQACQALRKALLALPRQPSTTTYTHNSCACFSIRHGRLRMGMSMHSRVLSRIKRGDNGGKKQTRENLSHVLDVGVNEQEAFEGCLEVRGESHHCVPHAHRIDGSNSQRAVAM